MPELGPATTSEPRTTRTRFTSNVRAMGVPRGVGDYPMAAVRNREPQVCEGVDFDVFNP